MTQQGVRLPADGQVDGPCRRVRAAPAHRQIRPAEIAGVQLLHAQPVDVPGFGHRHDAGGAPVQPVDAVEASLAQIPAHGPGHGDGLLRQGRWVDGDACGLVEDQQVLVLPQDVQGIVHRPDMGIVSGQVRHVGGDGVSGADQRCHGGGLPVQQNGSGPPLQPGEKRAGDPQLLPQEPAQGPALLLRRDGIGQQAHAAASLQNNVTNSTGI